MTSDDIETAAQLLAMRELSGIGDKRIGDLFETFGDATSVLEAPFEAFESFHYVDRETYEAFADLDSKVSHYRSRLTRAQERGIEIIPLGDDRYPESVRRHNAPVVLFARGNLDLLRAESVSFSGSRDANDVALRWTRETSTALAEAGYVIVSGGALGVDTAAHEAALKAGGKTIAVLPGGLDYRHLASNEDLYEQISEQGLLLSQQPPGEQPSRYDFLNRNKTNSALSRALVIGAAGSSGGTISQYRDAKSQGKDIFVPSYDLAIEPFEGIKEILSTNGATPVESGEDIIQALKDTFDQSKLGKWEE